MFAAVFREGDSKTKCAPAVAPKVRFFFLGVPLKEGAQDVHIELPVMSFMVDKIDKVSSFVPSIFIHLTLQLLHFGISICIVVFGYLRCAIVRFHFLT